MRMILISKYSYLYVYLKAMMVQCDFVFRSYRNVRLMYKNLRYTCRSVNFEAATHPHQPCNNVTDKICAYYRIYIGSGTFIEHI